MALSPTQIVNLVKSYGSTYSRGELVFPGVRVEGVEEAS